MRIYLDACCLNRPFDNMRIDRNRLEAEAVLAILRHIQEDGWELASSEALDLESEQNTDADRRQAVEALLSTARTSLRVDPEVDRRMEELASFSFREMDALHIACAEAARCDVMLSTDDKLLRKATKHASRLKVRVANPLQWLTEISP